MGKVFFDGVTALITMVSMKMISDTVKAGSFGRMVKHMKEFMFKIKEQVAGSTDGLTGPCTVVLFSMGKGTGTEFSHQRMGFAMKENGSTMCNMGKEN